VRIELLRSKSNVSPLLAAAVALHVADLEIDTARADAIAIY
jgi:hypothetical protein